MKCRLLFWLPRWTSLLWRVASVSALGGRCLGGWAVWMLYLWIRRWGGRRRKMQSRGFCRPRDHRWVLGERIWIPGTFRVRWSFRGERQRLNWRGYEKESRDMLWARKLVFLHRKKESRQWSQDDFVRSQTSVKTTTQKIPESRSWLVSCSLPLSLHRQVSR